MDLDPDMAGGMTEERELSREKAVDLKCLLTFQARLVGQRGT